MPKPELDPEPNTSPPRRRSSDPPPRKTFRAPMVKNRRRRETKAPQRAYRRGGTLATLSRSRLERSYTSRPPNPPVPLPLRRLRGRRRRGGTGESGAGTPVASGSPRWDCSRRGSTAGLPLPLGCGGAGSSSDRLWRVRLEVSPSCPPPTRLPIFVQGFKSISVRALGWWMMRLHQDLGSVGGRFGGVGFDCAPAAPPGRSEPRWKMNRASRGFYVIFFFFEVLCVSLGGALRSSFFNIPSLSKKKVAVQTVLLLPDVAFFFNLDWSQELPNKKCGRGIACQILPFWNSCLTCIFVSVYGVHLFICVLFAYKLCIVVTITSS